MSSSVGRFDRKARREFGRFGRTVVHRGELLRHPVYTRVLHWSVAIFHLVLLCVVKEVSGLWKAKSSVGSSL